MLQHGSWALLARCCCVLADHWEADLLQQSLGLSPFALPLPDSPAEVFDKVDEDESYVVSTVRSLKSYHWPRSA